MAIDSGLIKSVQEVCKWLEPKGCVLAAEPYNCTKLANILVTAAIASKLEDLKQAALVVAFILESDITDHISDALTDMVASKTIGHLGGSLKVLLLY
ncbi:hypothetical protein C0993_000476 [Termitomyces sp. T159_Od127]|nr:hypothetical protein C0993_000476 [Termitomyces sp. T159_Od127]